MRKMRKGFTLALALLLAAACALPCFTEGNGAGSAGSAGSAYRVVIQDDAGLLDTAELADVRAEMEAVAQYCNVGLYTTNRRSGQSAQEQAKAWGNRTFGTADYTVFVIDMYQRWMEIYSSERIYRVVTRAKANTITDNTYKYATNGKYADCAKEVFAEIRQVLEGYEIASPMRKVTNALVAVAVALLLAYLLIYARMEKETEVSVPGIITVMAAGAGTAVLAKKLTRTVKHSSSSGGGHGGGGGGFSGGGGGGGGGGHGF